MNSKKKSKMLISVFNDIFSRLPGNRKKQFWFIFLGMLFSSVVATISVGSIALFAAAFSSPDQILESKYILWAQENLALDFLKSTQGIMIAISCVMVILVGIKNILDNVVFYCVARYGAAVEAYFGSVLFNGFIHMPYEWHLNRNSADIILAIQWRSYIGHSLFNTVLKTMNDAMLVLLLLAVIFMANPLLSNIVFAITGIIAFLIYKKIHHLQVQEAEKCKEYDQLLNRQSTMGIHGIKDVKVLGETTFLTDFSDAAYNFARIQGMRNFYARLPIGLLETIGFAVLAGAIIIMLFFTSSSALEVTATMSLLIVAAWRILPAVTRIMTGFIGMRNILPYINREMEYMEDIDANAIYPTKVSDEVREEIIFDHELVLNDVFFSYKSREASVLSGINFQIKKGQTFGIVGYSGVGKSTLVDIIIGLLKPSSGKLLIDGIELSDSNCFAWFNKLSYVSQSPYICDGSVSENIAFGVQASEIDRDFVLECCRMAHMVDVLDSLPDGVDTLIGERGVRLSGGQRQRVAIARALYTKPELIIFDEATSSLDDKSERAIQDTINSLKGEKTVIIIAHRLKTVENCDSLIWLDAGKVKKIDTPKNVLLEYEESLR